MDFCWLFLIENNLFILNLLAYITLSSELLPLIFCILFYKKLNTKALKVFFIYSVILAVSITLSTTAFFLQSQKIYYYIVRIYTPVEYLLFALFLSKLYKNTIAQKIILFSTIPFILFCILDFFINKSPFSNYPSLVEFLAYFMFIIYFFYEKMKTVVHYPLYQSITFWICVGLFVYFTGNFFFFLFINSSSDPDVIAQIKNIYSIVTITKNVLLCSALFANETIENNDESLKIPMEMELDDFTLTNLKKS
ncbi:MAG: hypothetical protein QM737_14065 [Ferruginibacter sp.]